MQEAQISYVPTPFEHYMEVVKSILYSMGIDNADPDETWLMACYQVRTSEEDCADEYANMHYERRRRSHLRATRK